MHLSLLILSPAILGVIASSIVCAEGKVKVPTVGMVFTVSSGPVRDRGRVVRASGSRGRERKREGL